MALPTDQDSATKSGCHGVQDPHCSFLNSEPEVPVREGRGMDSGEPIAAAPRTQGRREF